MGVAAVSAAAHAALLALLALNAPHFVQAVPPPVFDVTVVPRYVLPEAQRKARPTQPAAMRPLAPRLTVRPDEPLPVAPLIAPAASGRPGDGRGLDLHPAPNPPGPKDQLREVLRRSTVGCANADAVRLGRRERDACDERFGKGAKDAPFIEPPMSRDKRRAFDEAAARKEAYRKYRDGNVPPGVSVKDGGPQMKELPPVMAPYR